LASFNVISTQYFCDCCSRCIAWLLFLLLEIAI